MTAALEALTAGDAALEADPRALEALDAFFTRATDVQARQTAAPAVDDALRADARAVFLLYMRLLAALRLAHDEPPAGSLLAQALHVTRVAPFCQLFVARSRDAVWELLRALVESSPVFLGSLAALRAVYCARFECLHRAVARAKRAEVAELTLGLYEMSLSLRGVASPATTELLFLGGKNAEEDLGADESSLASALVRCYERDLPTLQRHLATFDESHALDKLAVVADTRRLLLEVFGAYMDALMEAPHVEEEPSDPRETLLAVLHALTHGGDGAECDGGSFLSDMWLLCGLKDKVSDYFTRNEMDLEQLEYLEMIIDSLPKRRIVATEDKAAPDKREAASTRLETEEKHPVASDDGASLTTMVDQVRDLFPDLGDGFVELCLLASKRQMEVVINCLLENNPPPELLDVPQSLAKTDAEFERVKARVTGAAPATRASNKLDPSHVWVGKKPMEKEYDPQIGKKDQELADKMKQIVAQYEDEDEFVVATAAALPGGGALDEYDDDYNDEFEDYEPFSVHDGGQLDDQEAIRELNRRVRAKEEEDAFWESMKNRNHLVAMDEEDECKAEEKPPAGDGKSGTSNVRQQRPPPNGQPKTSGTKKKGDGKPGVGGKQETETPTPQQQRARVRNTKNKAKVANHHRKERALKKMG